VVEVLGSGLLYVGALAVALGAMNAIRPLGWMRVRRRAQALRILGTGLAAMAIGVALPAQDDAAATRRTRLDAFVPTWQFGEVHSIRVQASPDRVFRAVKDVTADEIRLFRTLTWIRNPSRPWSEAPESILAAPAHRPLLDVALHSGFLSLAEDQGHEVVVGTIVCCHGARVRDAAAFAAVSEPGFAKAGMNFLMEDEGGGWTRLTTETRVQATDAEGRRRFAAYWRAIYPGSALIRRMWLRAIKARAEREDSV
jgi:hypothetical protein